MIRISLLERAHAIMASSLRPGDRVVDATVGNGHDTLFLAHCVGESGRVYGFDVQSRAIDVTRQRLLERGVLQRVSLIQASHALMADHVPSGVKGVMFNLGYLPSADKTVITRVDSTLQALDAASRLLARGGVMTIIAYPGHAGGDIEMQALQEWCQALERDRFVWECILSQHQRHDAPRLFILGAHEISALAYKGNGVFGKGFDSKDAVIERTGMYS